MQFKPALALHLLRLHTVQPRSVRTGLIVLKNSATESSTPKLGMLFAQEGV
jgi:hypothetical protein